VGGRRGERTRFTTDDVQSARSEERERGAGKTTFDTESYTTIMKLGLEKHVAGRNMVLGTQKGL